MTTSSPLAKKLGISDILKAKKTATKLTMLTCYDTAFAALLAKTDVDMLLVGDSLATVMHGFENTLQATIKMMEMHTAAVRRGATNKFVVGDMPFLSQRQGEKKAVMAAGKLMQAGADAVKIEGLQGHSDVIKHVVESGIPVMGHLGYTPQATATFGKNIVQGKTDEAADKLLKDAQELEKIGCFSVVLECVPQNVAKIVSESINIPTIGIGAGVGCDGQVLVLQDMLGMNPDFSPKFLRKYANIAQIVEDSVGEFTKDVKTGVFPNDAESY